MLWSDINLRPPPRILQQFAGLWLLVFSALAVMQAVSGRDGLALALGALALLVGLPGLVKPVLVQPVYAGATLLTFPIGWTVSKVILACLFYGVFTPVALVFRLLGRDALSRRRRPMAETYWAPKPMATRPERYFRPF